MSLTLLAKSVADAVKAHRESAARNVVAGFGALPDRRLLCFFDDEDWPLLRGRGMAANRGAYFHSPRWEDTPYYVRGHALPDGRPAFEELIYLHGSTCSSDISLTMTFAHEMQHFVQHSNARLLWAANTLAHAMLRHLEPDKFAALGLRVCDIPFEREARIVAKRVAEKLFGQDLVRRHIEAKAAEHVTEQDATDWDCIRDLSGSTQYDLAIETRRFFPKLQRHKSELERGLRALQRDDEAFRQIDLDVLLSGKG
jgi:hypothetical protein